MRRGKHLLLIAAFTLLALTPSISSASTPRSGVRGAVLRSPTQPVCQPENPCAAPAVGVHLTFVRGSFVRHVLTNAHGRFSTRLKPGAYSVRVAGASFGYSPQQVTVRKRRMAVMAIVIDTGIR